MTGTLENQAMTLGGPLLRSRAQVVLPPNTTQSLLDLAEMTGNSPYFRYIVTAESLGGDAAQTNSVERTLGIAADATTRTDPLRDDLAAFSFLLEASGQNDVILASAGSVVISYQSSQELRGHFDATFGAHGDAVQGCFDVFYQKVSIVPAPSP